MVLTRGSVDDISLGSRPPEPLEKRARSSSPVKQRRPTQDWAALTRSADGSLDKLFSTTALSHDQLLHFSNSEASGRLHISKSNYAIPIPFQIQFPPRLTKSSSSSLLLDNSASSGASPTLVFTGNSYEPVTPDMSASPVFEPKLTNSRPASPEKPPSVITSRKKVSAFVRKTQSDHSDQLSMIEEKSSLGNSRSSSHKSKELPSIPSSAVLQRESDNVAVYKQGYHEPHDSNLPIKNLRRSSRRETSPPNTKIAASARYTKFDDMAPGEQSVPSGNSHSDGPGKSKVFHLDYNPGNPISQKTRRKMPESVAHAHSIPQVSSKKISRENLPQTASDESHPREAHLKEHGFDKRKFSDESRVSSVSSFSSVGDILNFNHAYMSSPNAKGDVIVSKELADFINGGEFNQSMPISTDRSMQPLEYSQGFDKHKKKSISTSAIRLAQESSDGEAPERIKVENAKENQLSDSKTQNSKLISDTKHQSESEGGRDLHSHLDSETAPLVISRRDSEAVADASILDDNGGAGIGFHFPNNKSNATNSNEVKNRSKFQRHHKRGSVRSSFLSDGKIEIPDLDDQKLWRNGGSKTLPSNTDSIEPLGIPSFGARDHLKAILNDRSYESDSDSSFNSQFSKLQTKTENKKSLPPSTSLGTVTSASSPVRHSRHRSMYNIDFDYESITSPQKNQHNRSRSSAYIDSLDGADQKSGLAKKSPYSRRADSQRPANSQVPFDVSERDEVVGSFENLDMKVNEPPKRISYAVDFKFGDATKNSLPSFDIQGPSQNYYREFKSSQKLSSRPSSFGTREESEAASSYQSSKTGRDTDSTAPTESDNVIIDLTEEKYDVCMINRNDSTTSYRSTMEKTKDGRNVEVVLVEEEDEDFYKKVEREDRDDLSSIYSRYMTNWGETSRLQRDFTPPSANLSRKFSLRSELSEASDLSGQSWAACSDSNFQVKSLASIRREQTYSNKLVEKPKTNLRLILDETTVAHTPSNHIPKTDTGYFDYSDHGAYDFKSFMHSQSHH